MINIIRQGDEQKPKTVYRFHCATCGCIWETDEYKLIGKFRGIVPAADCPNCGNKNVTNGK